MFVTAGVVVASSAASLVALRSWLLSKEHPRRHQEPFDGRVYQVGQAAVAERHSEDARATVLCMHGFLEDMRYFTHHYASKHVQLILVTSCDYHVPFGEPPYEKPAWAKAPEGEEGSIPYDAQVLIQALEHLPRTKRVRVHGHSRGGAVILEAAGLRPDLFEHVEVVLEAPVLPKAKPNRTYTALMMWLMPFLIPLWKRQPMAKQLRGAWGPLENPRKKELISALPFHPRRVRTLMANLHGIDRWMRERDPSLFRHLRRATVLVPAKDRVLDARTMKESAAAAGGHVQVVELDGCSHFALFDRPEALPKLED